LKKSFGGHRPVAARAMYFGSDIVFDTKTLSNFKGTRADIARAPPGARIGTSWRTSIGQYLNALCTRSGRLLFCRTAILRLEFIVIAV
jgi:hypothetical protein